MKNKTYIFRISLLISKEIAGSINEKEQAELSCWLQESEHNQSLLEIIRKEIRNSERQKKYSEKIAEEAFQKFLKRRYNKPRRHIQKFKYAAFWIIPFLLGSGILLSKFYAWDRSSGQVYEIVTESSLQQRPLLILTNGQELPLTNGQPPYSGDNVLQFRKNEDGSIIYANTATSGPLEFHSLQVPAQCDYHFTLSDSTRVWLNAESCLKYPVAFGPDERTIYASGEIYLEVAKDLNRPFYVITNDLKIEVTGTSFNINSYPDEEYTSVTLIEGKVTTYADHRLFQLLPQRQLIFNRNNHKVKIQKVDTDDIIAWKEGAYIFKAQPLGKVAKILERWYDVKIIFRKQEYEQTIYTGVVWKEDTVQDFIHILNEISSFNCYLEGKILYIN